MTVIMAKVYLKESCDSSIPFDCAPVIRMVGAADAEQLASVHGVEFQEETEEELGDLEDLEDLESVIEEVEEPQAAGLCCPLDDGPWRDSPCEDLTGWSVEEAALEFAKHVLMADLKKLRDEGVI